MPCDFLLHILVGLVSLRRRYCVTSGASPLTPLFLLVQGEQEDLRQKIRRCHEAEKSLKELL